MITFTTWQKVAKQTAADQRAVVALSNGSNQDAHAAAASAIELYKHLKHTLEIISSDIEESMRQAKEIIADVMQETKTDRIEAPAGVAYVPKPGTTISYNTQALDLLCNSEPELAAKLAPFRQVKARPGALTIR